MALRNLINKLLLERFVRRGLIFDSSRNLTMLLSLFLAGLVAGFVSGQTPTATGCAAVAAYQSKFLQANPQGTSML